MMQYVADKADDKINQIKATIEQLQHELQRRLKITDTDLINQIADLQEELRKHYNAEVSP